MEVAPFLRLQSNFFATDHGLRTTDFFLCLVFDDRLAYDLLDSRLAVENGPQPRLAKRRHPLLAARDAQLVGRSSAGDLIANLVVDQNQLKDAHATLMTGVVAAIAATAIGKLLADHV